MIYKNNIFQCFLNFLFFCLFQYSVDARDTISDLQLLIQSQKVIEVDYKGNTSFRNASKWSRLSTYKSKPEVFVKERLNSSLVSEVVGELVIEEPDYLDQGVPPNRLAEQICERLNLGSSKKFIDHFLTKGKLNKIKTTKTRRQQHNTT